MLTAEVKAKLAAYQKEAEEKLAALPERIDAEAEDSKLDPIGPRGRVPHPIVPLIEIDPAVMGPHLEAVGTGKVPDAVADTYGVVRRVCKQQVRPFAMRCDQCLDLLKLASQPNA